LALDVYFREDILNVLRATYAAADGPAALLSELVRDPELRHVPLDRLVQVYRQGFCTALGAVGLAFGLDSPERRTSSPGHVFATPGGPVPLHSVAPVGRTQAPSPQADAPALAWLGVYPDHERG
jgi:hypothetical protein